MKTAICNKIRKYHNRNVEISQEQIRSERKFLHCYNCNTTIGIPEIKKRSQ